MTGLLVVGVALLGGVGAVARFAIDGGIQARRLGEFPLGTFVVNVAGSLLLGFLVGARLHHDALLLAGTAMLGSFTTFSTWMLETHRLAQDGETRMSAGNVAVSLAAGIAAVVAGRALGGLL